MEVKRCSIFKIYKILVLIREIKDENVTDHTL